jgi:23S rRNA (uracil1939-C5)-methyltransferase
VERLIAGGEGLARAADGRVVFARGGLPGETVRVAISEERRDWVRGEVTEVVVSSPERVVPPCPRRLAGCGGCDWQHLEVAAQRRAKLEIVRESYRRVGRLGDVRVVDGGGVPDRGYRTTIRVIGDEDGRPSFREERSTHTVTMDGCLVAHPALLAVLDAIRLPVGVEASVRVSLATGEVTVVAAPDGAPVEGLPLHVRTGPDAWLTESVAGHEFQVSAASFFQSGPPAAELLVDAVRRAAPELSSAGHVADLYGGVGLFSVALAEPRARVTLVETSRYAIADARRNLVGRPAAFLRGEVGAWRTRPQDPPVDVVIADPARSGLGKPGVRAVVGSAAPVVVLVSCDPVSAARDAALFAAAGYQHDSTEVIDVFPHTHHVETVTRFSRTAPVDGD